ncbi:MAG TPA: lamin tail domain-containing protein [Polyangia bacterium]|jgi:hypothetical protein|nr:lamin tail domain-containing protein [Polyangia bacterium]
MTRSIPTLPFAILLSALAGACGPGPIKPRAVPARVADAAAPPDAHTPPSSAEKVDAPSAPIDAGAPSASDGGKRPELSARDAAVAAPGDAGADAEPVTADAGADAESVDPDARAPSPRPPVAGEIVIAEVLANPNGTDTGREWIEIASRAAEPVTLADLHLADATLDVVVPAGNIAPGERIVLGQAADPGQNGGAPVAVAYGTRLALNNGGEELSLCIGPCAGGVLIDRVGWKALAAAYDGHALVFDHDANRTCAATEPFGTAGDFGTPGVPDSACVVPDGGF